jgi:hypothetical protein
METDSYREHGDDHLMLSAADMAWFFDHYLPDRARRADPAVSPLGAPDLSGVAPAIVVTDEFDPLRDEGLAYAERLREAGVTVTAHHYEDMMHVFFQFVNVFERGTESVARVGSDVRAAMTTSQNGSTSRAVRYDQYGGIDVLELVDLDAPPPGPGQLRIRVKAAGLNLGESKIRQGLLHERWPATFPSGQGTDLAGVVEQVGDGV